MIRRRRVITACAALFALAGLLCLGGGSVMAMGPAGTATANADAIVVTPLGISTSVDLSFGTLAFGAGAGTAKIDPDGSRSVTGSAVASGGSPAAAEFAIGGEGTNTYAITLPGSITISDGDDNMTVNSFTSSPDTTGTLSAGADTLLVGATLHSLGSQPAGSYTGTFNVSVTYN